MKRNVQIIAAVVVLLALGVWAYTAYQEHTTRKAVLALVKDGGDRLRMALGAQSGAPADFELHARTVEPHVATVRKLDTSSLRPLADAADGYLVTVREILRRLSVIQASRERLAKSLEALTEHVQSDRGAAAWPQQAVRLKESLDRDFREYRIATESYASLLESLPGAQTKLAPHVNAAWLLDEKLVRDARAQALDALARTDENIRKVTQLDGYRGRRRQGGAR